MKNIIFVLFLFLCLCSLTSCQNLLPNNGDDNIEELPDDNTNDNGNQVDTNEILETPVLVIDESTGIVTWDIIADATYYNYVINNGAVKSTTINTITLANESTLSVQAANGESVSEWSYAVTNYDTSDVYDEYIEEVYVKFHNTSLDVMCIKSGEKINAPVAPEITYYTFDNWYADPFYVEVFDFNQPITKDTIIYANYIESNLLANTYYWVKGSPHITSNVMSAGTDSDWHFMPLKFNKNNTTFKEFYTTVTVTGATSTNPAAFIIMDGFSDDSGRTYWKNNGKDFTITRDGVYNIYFTVESEYASNINARYEVITNSVSDIKYENKVTLITPIVTVNSEYNIASWNRIGRAKSYEVIIDNGLPINITQTTITLNKGSHITVRAVGTDEYSNWSIPKANINHIVINHNKDNTRSVYFVGYDSYNVELNTQVNKPNDPILDNYTFGGWYTDYNCTVEVVFPYTVTSNVVFYPKWITDTDFETKIYYNLVTESGEYIKGLTWNIDNYTFDEYETGVVELTANTKYFIVSTSDEIVMYGPYIVGETGKYKMYFSEDNSWDGSNVYITKADTRIYFTDVKGWTDTIYAYVWNSGSGEYDHAWPGVIMTFLEINGQGQEVYYIDVDLTLYDRIIFSHGSNGTVVTQTIDVTLAEGTVNGYYVTENKTNGKYGILTYKR